MKISVILNYNILFFKEEFVVSFIHVATTNFKSLLRIFLEALSKSLLNYSDSITRQSRESMRLLKCIGLPALPGASKNSQLSCRQIL
ncbi:unnamed protein product [Citrullus colocynthis]|uniref:Uncharacterized protein n=1 Tax=Citrullus colocynthis TaxID=252529 RepID=A0ABP0ZBX4_9ROSI